MKPKLITAFAVVFVFSLGAVTGYTAHAKRVKAAAFSNSPSLPSQK